MPINKFNEGSDVAIDFVGPSGPIRVSNITSFTKRQMTKRESSSGIDGVTHFQYIPGGWEGSIALDRFNRIADDAIHQFEQLYFDGADVPPCVIVETITEPDGTQSQWRYVGVMFAMPQGGAAEQGKKISQTLEWCASFRKRVA